MGETELHVLEDTEQMQIELWRAEELERAGYSHRAAGRLATRLDVDLHQAVRLLERGCSPELAHKILL
jgi:succinylglutamate desuccinylase